MNPRIDISGQKFGRLQVVKYIGQIGTANGQWLLQCDCGNKCYGVVTDLRKGRLVSCGCRRIEHALYMSRVFRTTHGMRHSSEYTIYKNAKARCTNPKHKSYRHYGGRGIQFRFNSFEEFFAVVGKRPVGKSIDRIDNEGHYEIGNLRWATAHEQQLNKRKGLKRKSRKLALAQARERTTS